LTSKEENLTAQSAKEKVSEMLSKMDKIKMNVAMNKRGGEDIPPRLLGHFPYSHLQKHINVQELAKELQCCGGVKNWDPSDGPAKGLRQDLKGQWTKHLQIEGSTLEDCPLLKSLLA
jgi:hypothetical protein